MYCRSLYHMYDQNGSIHQHSGINKELLQKIRSQNIQSVVIITGSGHHATSGSIHKPRLFSSVKRLLQEYELDFQIVKDNNGFEGAFRVSIS